MDVGRRHPPGLQGLPAAQGASRRDRESRFGGADARLSGDWHLSRWSSPSRFVAALAEVRLPDVFNPYSDRCPDHDLPEGPAIRRTNLCLLLDAALAQPIDELWVGLELGRQGGRRTGLPLTDEVQLEALARYWRIDGVRRATTGLPVRETTATFVWEALRTSRRRVLFWNAFPLQSHQPGSANNRNHTRAEAADLRPYLEWVVERSAPSRIVGLGRHAQAALARAGVAAEYVRHPARAGGPTFLAQIKS